MADDLYRIIGYFENNGNIVSIKDLKKVLGFTDSKIGQLVMKGDFIRNERGSYSLSKEFYKKIQVTLPQGILRLDKQAFTFSPSISRVNTEKYITDEIWKRANRDNLIIKKISFSGDRYNIDFMPARYSVQDNHLVFDAFTKSADDLIMQGRVHEGQGRWELGRYFRQLAECPPKDYHQSVAEVISVIKQRHGDIGRLEKISEHYHGINPVSLSLETYPIREVDDVRLDPKSGTYQFGDKFHQVSESQYKTTFVDISEKLGLHAKKFVSMTFKRILPAIGIGLSVEKVANADDKVEAAIEEATLHTGGFGGGLVAAILAAPSGPIGMTAAGIAGGMAGSEFALNSYHTIRAASSGIDDINKVVETDPLIESNRFEAISIVGDAEDGIFGTEDDDLLKIKNVNALEENYNWFFHGSGGYLSKTLQQMTLNSPISGDSSHDILSKLSTNSKPIQALNEKSHRSLLQMMEEAYREQLRSFARMIALEMRLKLPEDEEWSQSELQKNWLLNRESVLNHHFEKLNIKENSAEASFLSYMVSEAYFYPDKKSIKNSKTSEKDYLKTNQSIKELRDTAKKEIEDYAQKRGDLFEQETILKKQSSQKLGEQTHPIQAKRFINKMAEVTNTIGWISEFAGNSKLSYKMFTSAQALTLLPTALESGAQSIETLASMFTSGASISLGALSTAFTATTPILILGSLIQQIFSSDDEENFNEQLMAWLNSAIQHLDRKLDYVIKGIGVLEDHLVLLQEKVNLVLENIEKLGEFIAEWLSTLYKKADERHTLLAQTSRQITSENAATQAMILEWWGSNIQSYNEKLQRAVKKGGKALDSFLENHFDNEFVNAKFVVTSKAITSADKELSVESIPSLLKSLKDPRKFIDKNYPDVFNAINLIQEYSMLFKDELGVLFPEHEYTKLSHAVGLHVLTKSILDLITQLQNEGKNIKAFLPLIEDDIHWLDKESFKLMEFLNKFSRNELKKLIGRSIEALLQIKNSVNDEIASFELEQTKLVQAKMDPIVQREHSMVKNEQNWGRSYYTRPLVWRRPPLELGGSFASDTSWNTLDPHYSKFPSVGYIHAVPQIMQQYYVACQSNSFTTQSCNHDHVNVFKTDGRWIGAYHDCRNEAEKLYLSRAGGHWAAFMNGGAQQFRDFVKGFHDITLAQELQTLSSNDFLLEQQEYVNKLHQELVFWYKNEKDKDSQKLKVIIPKSGKGVVLRLPNWIDYKEMFSRELFAEKLGIGYLEFVYSESTKFTIDFDFVFHDKTKSRITLYQFKDDINNYILKHTNPGNHNDQHSVYYDMDMISYYWNGGYYFHIPSAKQIFYSTDSYFQTVYYSPHLWQNGRWNQTTLPQGSVFEASLNYSEHQDLLQRNIDELILKKNLEINSRIRNNILRSSNIDQSIQQFELHFRMLHHIYMMIAPSKVAAKEIHNIFLRIASACDRSGILEFTEQYQKLPSDLYLSPHLVKCIADLTLLENIKLENHSFLSELIETLDELRTRYDAPVTAVKEGQQKAQEAPSKIEKLAHEVIDLDKEDRNNQDKPSYRTNAATVEDSVTSSASKHQSWFSLVLSALPQIPMVLKTVSQSNNQIVLVEFPHKSNSAEQIILCDGPPRETITLDPITGKYIFDYSFTYQDEEIAGAMFYDHNGPCKSMAGNQDNILELRGLYSGLRLQPEDVCSALPPSLSAITLESAGEGAKMGAMRGAANVIGGKNSWRATSIFYSGYYLYRFYDAYNQDTNQDCWNAMCKAGTDTLWLAGTEVAVSQASRGMKEVGNYLQQMKHRGARLVGKVTSKLSGVVGYSIYAYEGVIAWQASPTPMRTVTQFATRVVSNITSGYVAQQATEKVGALFGNAIRFFKRSKQPTMIIDERNLVKPGLSG